MDNQISRSRGRYFIFTNSSIAWRLHNSTRNPISPLTIILGRKICARFSNSSPTAVLWHKLFAEAFLYSFAKVPAK